MRACSVWRGSRVASFSGVSQEEPAQESGHFGEMPIFTTRRIVQTVVLVFILLGAIYFLFPKLVGLGDALSRLDDADPLWIAIAIAFNVAAYATYIALFKAVVGGDALRLSWTETYEINMAGVAATLLFSAGGAGGAALTYSALPKAGMARRDVGRRMVAFVSLHSLFYPVALILFGVLLRTGVMNGKGSVELTIVPASVAGLLLILGVLVMLIPADLEQRLTLFANSDRSHQLLEKAARVP